METYEVVFRQKNDKTNFWEKKSIIYKIKNKNQHKLVEKTFKKDFPGCDLVSIIY